MSVMNFTCSRLIKLRVLVISNRSKSTSTRFKLKEWEKNYVNHFANAQVNPTKHDKSENSRTEIADAKKKTTAEEVNLENSNSFEVPGTIRLAISEDLTFAQSKDLVTGKIKITEKIFKNQKIQAVKLLNRLGYQNESKEVASLPLDPKNEMFWPEMCAYLIQPLQKRMQKYTEYELYYSKQ